MVLLLLLGAFFLAAGVLATGDEFSNLEKEDECEKYQSLGFHCVPYWQCDTNRTIITDGSNIIDFRSGSPDELIDEEKLERAYESGCPKIVEVCCRLWRKSSNTLKDPEKRETKSIQPRPRCGKRVNTIPEDVENFLDKQAAPLLADVPEADFGEWPHVCLILKEEELQIDDKTNIVVPNYKAGASLLAPEVILTGVNRIIDDLKDLSKLRVRCGEWDVLSTAEPRPYQERKVIRMDKHPEYNPDNSFNNFLIFYVDKPFDLDVHISPVCLPPPTLVFPPSTLCVANGWGKDRFGNDGKYRTKMKELSLGLVDTQKCQDILRKTRLGRFFELHSSFICAGGSRGIDTCKGDGGSPLVCQTDNGAWTQVGLAAWGVSCGEEGKPGVYSNVPSASCWIDSVVSRYFSGKKEPQGSYFGFTQSDCPDSILNSA